jgi:hypothetical protein
MVQLTDVKGLNRVNDQLSMTNDQLKVHFWLERAYNPLQKVKAKN